MRPPLFALLAVSLLTSATPVFAIESETSKKSQPAGVEFTKIQDLNPEAKSENRPIKQKWAVVIGASRFKESRLQPIGADDMSQSARRFYDYLVDNEGGRFDKNHVRILLDGHASRQNIMSALGRDFLGNAAGPDDLVVVYVATSGFPTTDGNTYLCAYDCSLDNIYGTCISMQTLMSTLKDNLHTDRIVLVLQAAYSGAAELESGAKSLGSSYNLDLGKVVLGNGFMILSSSGPNEITWSSSFTKNLTDALRKENGLISLNEAFAIAREKTATETSSVDRSKKQVPVMKSKWTGKDLVLGAPPAERVASLPSSVSSFLSAEGSYMTANNLVAEGKIKEAIEHYKLAVAADPGYADALADYGAALALENHWELAAGMYKKAIEAKPKDGLYHLNYARVLDKLGNSDDSWKELTIAYKLSPKDVTVLSALSGKSLSQGRIEDAVHYMEAAVDLYPKRADLRERLTFGLMKTGEFDQAEAQAKEAVRLNPKSASARTTLGSVLMVKGYVVPAANSYKEAAALKPKDANIRWLLSRAMEKGGDRDGAISELSKFIELVSKDDPRRAKAEEHLTVLKSR